MTLDISVTGPQYITKCRRLLNTRRHAQLTAATDISPPHHWYYATKSVSANICFILVTSLLEPVTGLVLTSTVILPSHE